ncbi:B12-binding domain-containing radical SAM protein [Desulfosediminicola sp.]|uniref:B12-binding domain-containing radical SAM protein n=1 Tax=Desulfosediminicola sp. TaxID=2886825 RepID=UPI003AF26654
MQTTKNKVILLVHPLGYSSSKAAGDVSRLANIMPPLGLASISAYLTEQGFDNDIIDCYAHPQSEQLIQDYLRVHKPAFIGFSCTTANFLDGERLARMAKEVLPEVKVVFGGVHVSALKERVLLDYPVIDYLVVGEGEETLSELLQSPATPKLIEGLVYKDVQGEVCWSGRRKQLLDLDKLPFPAYHKLAGYPDAYSLPIFNYPKVPNGSCLSSRGCPYACSYCDRSVFKRTFRYNSADYLYRHMKYLKETYSLKHLNFYDDQFTFNRKRVAEFCELIIAQPLGITFNCAARAEHLDPELLQLMKKAGCWMISLGIETGDPDLLAMHRQNPDLEMLKEKVHMIQSAGIRVKGLLMMGLPGETEKSIEKSKEYVHSLNLDDFNLAKFTPFPGSPIYDGIKGEGGEMLGTFDEDWREMDCMQFRFVPKGMTAERLDELFIDFYRSHFQRARVIWGYVTMLWKSPDSWLRFLGNLMSFLRFARTNKRIAETK